MNTNGKLITFGVLAAVFLALIIFLFPFTQIPQGSQGIVLRNGATNRIVGPGLHFVVPAVENVVEMSTQVRKEETGASAASSDLQTVQTRIAVNYKIEDSKVADIYSRIGVNFADVVIDPNIQKIVKGVTAKYTAEELITERTQVTTDIQNQLAEVLAPSDILVTAVSITDFDFSPSFNAAIEAKVTAEQNAQAAKNKLDQVKYESEQTIVAAQGVAEAQRIKAAALQSQGGKELVNLTLAEKWDGHLPTTMVPGSSVPFINVNN